MRTGDKRLFSNKKKLEEMLSLRREGWSFPQLAKRYKCDHTSILYWCQKLNVKIVGITSNERRVVDLKRIKIIGGRKHCNQCDLLISSEFFCENCKEFKKKIKLENDFGGISS